MRQPAFIGIREDKNLEDIIKEDSLKKARMRRRQ